eukprot:m.16029 g.16029  ORF g.16029 m.16029 type:complete len:529 (+) comp26690_c0_seq2:3786-5372(+)
MENRAGRHGTASLRGDVLNGRRRDNQSFLIADPTCPTVNIIEHLENTMAGFLARPHGFGPLGVTGDIAKQEYPMQFPKKEEGSISGVLNGCKVPSLHMKTERQVESESAGGGVFKSDPHPKIEEYSSLAKARSNFKKGKTNSDSQAPSSVSPVDVLVHACSVCGQKFHSFAALSSHISTHVAAASVATPTFDVSPAIKSTTRPPMQCSFCGFGTSNAVEFFEHTASHVENESRPVELFMSAQQQRSRPGSSVSQVGSETSRSLAAAVRREAARFSVCVDRETKTLNMPSPSVSYATPSPSVTYATTSFSSVGPLKTHVCLTSSSAGAMVEPFSPISSSSASPISAVPPTQMMMTETNRVNGSDVFPSFVHSPESPPVFTSNVPTSQLNKSRLRDWPEEGEMCRKIDGLVAPPRRNSDVNGHVCATCGKTFRLRSYLRIHQRLHTGDLPYNCPVCGKRFNQSWNRNVHMRIHSGIQPYRCKLCGKNFRSAIRLREHLTMLHGTQQNEMQEAVLLQSANGQDPLNETFGY